MILPFTPTLSVQAHSTRMWPPQPPPEHPPQSPQSQQQPIISEWKYYAIAEAIPPEELQAHAGQVAQAHTMQEMQFLEMRSPSYYETSSDYSTPTGRGSSARDSAPSLFSTQHGMGQSTSGSDAMPAVRHPLFIFLNSADSI